MVRVLLLLLATAALIRFPVADSQTILHASRSSASDLEVGGDLAGFPAGQARFIRYDDLLRLPQETFTVSDDDNLPKSTEISGVNLETLAHLTGHVTSDLLVVAICDDRYRTNYPYDYLEAHHPLLVLRINGMPHDQWSQLKQVANPGPYLISHPFFKPAFKVLSHQDEPQIPYGVVRLEFRRESEVFARIRPRGDWPANSPVEQGYAIARQDCLRCHNVPSEGATKSGRSWAKLAQDAERDPQRFRQIIHNPVAVDAKATMPAHADYDDATLNALTTYFKTFRNVRGDR
jgi:mono/diheme cytochrome c family protein